MADPNLSIAKPITGPKVNLIVTRTVSNDLTISEVLSASGGDENVLTLERERENRGENVLIMIEC